MRLALSLSLGLTLMLAPAVSYGDGKGAVQELIKGVAKGIGEEIGKELTGAVIDSMGGRSQTQNPDHPGLTFSAKENVWRPAPGYKWVEPKNVSNLSVKWSPGSAHPNFQHIVASGKEGEWVPEDGYTWLSAAPSDLSVKRICIAGIDTISRTTRINLGGEELVINSPIGFNEIARFDPDLSNSISNILDKANIKKLAVYVSDEDIGKRLNCLDPDLKKQIILFVLAYNFGKNVSRGDFLKIKEELNNIYGLKADELFDFSKKNLDKMLDGSAKLNQMIPLGVYIDKYNVICSSNLQKITYAEGQVSVLENDSTCIILIKNRLLHVTASRIFMDADGMDFDWSRGEVVKFANEIIAGNQ